MMLFKSKSILKLSVALSILATLIILCDQVEGQFFTKSSSKSIPRMGRRSKDSVISVESRRALIDSLLDQLGPELITIIDSNGQQTGQVDGSQPEQQDTNYMGRNERALSSPFGFGPQRGSGSVTGNSRQREASLAMRALNANRLLEHLASGQPLSSYERIDGAQSVD